MKKISLTYMCISILIFVSWGQTIKSWDINIYNFGGLQPESGISINKSVNLVNSARYNGMIVKISSTNLSEFDSYLARASNKAEFDIHAAFYVLYDKQGNFNNDWKIVVDKLVGTKTKIWLITGRKSSKVSEKELLTNIENIVRYANDNNVPVLLYPHSNNIIDHAEQVVEVINKLPSLLKVNLALILNHEFRYGNGYRLDEVIYNVKDYIDDVVITGTDTIIDNSFFPTYISDSDRLITQTQAEFETATIQPLGQGQFDLRFIFKLLKEIEYTGEIGYINHRFDVSNGWNFQQSLACLSNQIQLKHFFQILLLQE